MDIDFDGEPIEIEVFETEKEDSVYCISPYLATTHQAQFKSSLWLDTNVMLRTASTNIKPNIQKLLAWANARGMDINLDLAIWELSRSIPIDECLAKVEECTKALRMKFGLNVPHEMWIRQTQYRYAHSAEFNKYIDEQTCYLIIIKYFYHLNGAFEKKCELFASFIHDYLPLFRTTYLAGVLYFFAKQRGDLFEKKIKRKWHSDMDRGQSSTHLKQAKNAASDLVVITFVTYLPLIPLTSILNIPYIATSDHGLAGFMSEIGYNGINIGGPYSIGNAIVGYREKSIARSQNISAIADQLYEKFSLNRNLSNDDRNLRLKNLSNISEIILEKDFKIELSELRKIIDQKK
jgi:hypothetical protein